MLVVPVGDETLQTADTDGFALDASDALALALCLLRTDSAADGGQGRRLVDDLIGALEVKLPDLGDEFGDMYVDRTAADAGHILAVETSCRLVQRGRLIVAESDLLEVAPSFYGILHRHGILFE